MVPSSANPVPTPHVTQPPVKPKKPLLIKEQPLLIQDLLDQEKQEQERARLVLG